MILMFSPATSGNKKQAYVSASVPVSCEEWKYTSGDYGVNLLYAYIAVQKHNYQSNISPPSSGPPPCTQ